MSASCHESATACGRQAARISFVYLAAALLTALFGGVYELFSHGVWSGWMVYAFAFPLAGGALPYAAVGLWGKRLPDPTVRLLGHCAVATFTVGSLVQGVLAIYGTTNRLTGCYWAVGGLLCALAAVLAVKAAAKRER